MKNKNIWFKSMPHKEGKYWFYGFLNKNDIEPKLIFCEAKSIGENKVVIIGNDSNMFESDFGDFWGFCHVDLPILPDLNDLQQK